MLLKVVTVGASRDEVLHRMETALLHCNLYGVPTNIPLLLNTLRLPRFRTEGADSRTLEEHKAELVARPPLSPLEICNALASLLFSVQSGTEVAAQQTLRRFCNTHSLRRVASFVVDDTPCSVEIENGDHADCFHLEMKEWGKAVPVELVDKKQNEVIVRVGEQILHNVVYKDNDDFRVFPTVSTEGIYGECLRRDPAQLHSIRFGSRRKL